MNQTSSQWIGIDVSKATLDVAVQPSGAQWSVANRAAPIEALVEQLTAVGPQRIEVNRGRPVGRHHVANAGEIRRLDRLGKRNRARVDRRIDPLLELDDDCRLPRGNNAVRGQASALSSFW